MRIFCFVQRFASFFGGAGELLQRQPPNCRKIPLHSHLNLAIGLNLPWLIQFCAITDRSIRYVRKHRGFCNNFFEFGLKDLLLLGCSLAELVSILIQRAHVFQLYQFGKAWCFFPWSRLTMFEILRAGPNLIFMYFIIISSVKSKRAFPSISWVLNISTCGPSVGSKYDICATTCSIVHCAGSLGAAGLTTAPCGVGTWGTLGRWVEAGGGCCKTCWPGCGGTDGWGGADWIGSGILLSPPSNPWSWLACWAW